MPSYRFLFDGTPVCSLNLERLQLALRAGGPDSLSWSYETNPLGTPLHEIHDEITLTCQTLDDEGTVTATETLFLGHVIRRPARDEGTSAGFDFVAENGWGDMRRVILTQVWKSWDPTTEALVDRAVPRVVLGLATDGTVQTTGATLGEIIDHAEAKGALVTAGTLSPALTVPPTELVDTTCDAALRQILAYHPDHIAWIEDGETLHVRPPSALSTITIADTCEAGLLVSHDPQTDEIPGGVVIVFEKRHQIDGAEKIERIHQTAGSSLGWPPPIYMTIPLAGVNVTSRKEVIETRTLPVPGDTSATLAKNFLKGLIPDLADAANADLRITAYEVIFADPKLDYIPDPDTGTVNPNSRPIDRGTDTVDDFPRMLVSGQVQPWFPPSVKQYDALLNVTVTYTGTNAELKAKIGNAFDISEPITITNAEPKIYSAIDSVEAGDEPISGLATSYWNAINQARDEGTLRGDLQGQYLDLRPGRKVLLSEYFDTAAVIRETTYDILAKTFECGYGNSEYLNPKTLQDLARAMARNRPSWKRPEERTDASADSASGGTIREGGKASPQYAKPTRRSTFPWDLKPSETSGQFTVAVGTILKGDDSVEQVLTCTNPTDTFTAAADKILAIKIEEIEPTEYTLVLLDEWPEADGYAVTYSGTVEGEDFEFTARHFPLWQIVATPSAEADLKLGEDLYGLPLCDRKNLQIVQSIYRTPDEEFVQLPSFRNAPRALAV